MQLVGFELPGLRVYDSAFPKLQDLFAYSYTAKGTGSALQTHMMTEAFFVSGYFLRLNQRSQYPLIREDTLNHSGLNIMVEGIFLK